MRFVLDTNAVIYLQRGLVDEKLPIGEYFISVITEIELLSFTKLTQEQQTQLQQFIDSMEVVGIDIMIKSCTIDLRKNYRLKIPDALIVATALMRDAELFTNDIQLTRIPNLRCRMLKLKTE